MRIIETKIMNLLVKNLSDDELLEVHRQFCETNRYTDDEIYHNDEEFFEMFFTDNIDEAIRAVCLGEYNYTDKYVRFNGYANLESFNSISENICMDELAKCIKENPADFRIDLTDFDD